MYIEQWNPSYNYANEGVIILSFDFDFHFAQLEFSSIVCGTLIKDDAIKYF